LPTHGRIEEYLTPGGPGIRIDSGIYSGYTIVPHYDSMVSKLIVWALDWDGVIKKARRALDEYYIEGIKTNIPLHQHILENNNFQQGIFTTSFLDEILNNYVLMSMLAPKEDQSATSFITNLIQRGMMSFKGDML
jgi:pyruvate carboxylase subunit A